MATIAEDPTPRPLLFVCDLSTYATPTVLGTVDFDLSLEVDLNEDSPARSKQVQVPRALAAQGRGAQQGQRKRPQFYDDTDDD